MALTVIRYLEQLRPQVCRILFPAAMVWLLILFLPRAIARLERLNPFTSGGVLHALFETVVLWVPVLSAMACIIWLLMRNFRFLRLPESIPTTRIATCIAVSGAALFVVLTIVMAVAGYLFLEPASDSHFRYHTRVWSLSMWCAAALTPLATLLWAWWALRDDGVTR